MNVVGKAQKQLEKVFTFLNCPNDVGVILNVPSLEPYYKNFFVSVVPLFNGSGTRLKILESAAYGRPVPQYRDRYGRLRFYARKNVLLFKNADSFMKRDKNPARGRTLYSSDT